MHKLLIPIAFVVFSSSTAANRRAAELLRDSSGGDDTRSGLSESAAWKSLDKVTDIFSPGWRDAFTLSRLFQAAISESPLRVVRRRTVNV